MFLPEENSGGGSDVVSQRGIEMESRDESRWGIFSGYRRLIGWWKTSLWMNESLGSGNDRRVGKVCIQNHITHTHTRQDKRCLHLLSLLPSHENTHFYFCIFILWFIFLLYISWTSLTRSVRLGNCSFIRVGVEPVFSAGNFIHQHFFHGRRNLISTVSSGFTVFCTINMFLISLYGTPNSGIIGLGRAALCCSSFCAKWR